MSQTTIRVRRNGPLRVEGEFTILDADDQPFDLAGRTSIALCRCSRTDNAPFCDGTHKKVGFESECPARQLPPPTPKP
jgi:CDGSH-type Zn-finger protein